MKTITRREALELMVATGASVSVFGGCTHKNVAQQGQVSSEVADETRRIRILATSDTHGMFMPWNYALDEEHPTGSMAQLAAAVGELRDQDTLLVDAGDTIQDNMADIFHADAVHPMIVCMNELGYDVGVTGNHEYNFGMDVLRKTVASFQGKVLTGNVWDENGKPVADGYTIITKSGIRVGFIGMVTPQIQRWDAINLKGCTVTDPVKETRKIIDQIAGETDVLIGVMHMGLENEYRLKNSGVRDLANACPELDLVVAAHTHVLNKGEEINGVLVVENKHHAQTLSLVDLTLKRDGDGWRVAERSSSPVDIGTYKPDPRMAEVLAPFDERAKAYAHEVVGVLEGGPLAPEPEISTIPQAMLEDTALIDLIQRVQLHYSQADISSTALFTADSNIEPGPIRRCDASLIYKHTNTLHTIRMTGAQLRKYMETSANIYRQYQPGDLTIGFDSKIPLYSYDMFEGVNYKVNVAAEPGKRIEDLTLPDGTPVADDDVFVVATNNFRATTNLLVPGAVFEESDMPELVEADIAGSIGGIRDLIIDYIANVCGGTIQPTVSPSWSIVGNDWDPQMHQKAVELVAEGKLSVENIEDGKRLPPTVITEDDVRKQLA